MWDKFDVMRMRSHNDETAALNAAFEKRTPWRVPVNLAGFDERFFVMNPSINTHKVTWKELNQNADAVIAYQIDKQKWWRSQKRPFADIRYPIGDLPDEEWDSFTFSFESAHEMACYGAKVDYIGNDNPDCHYILTGDENKWKFKEIQWDADPEGDGVFGQAFRFYEVLKKRCAEVKVDGKPIAQPHLPWRLGGGDGPFTVACGLRGSEIMLDLYEDPEYFCELMEFITDGMIARWQAARDYARARKYADQWAGPFSTGDDSAAMLSPRHFREFMAPYWRKMLAIFSPGGEETSAHMCGDAQHILPLLTELFNTQYYDTGFPSDLGYLRSLVGEGVHIQGNITPALMGLGAVEAVEREILAILRSGVTRGRRFLLKDGTNVPPLTNIDNLCHWYEFARSAGIYTQDDRTAADHFPGESLPPWRKE